MPGDARIAEALAEHRMLTLRYMHERAARMMRCFYRNGDHNDAARYREEVDALEAVFEALRELAALRRPDDGRSEGVVADGLMKTFGRLRDCADDVRYARREPQWIAASIRSAAEEVRSAAQSLEARASQPHPPDASTRPDPDPARPGGRDA